VRLDDVSSVLHLYDDCAQTRCSVPLDYSDASVGQTRIALIRAQAANTANRKGTIVINPGTCTQYCCTYATRPVLTALSYVGGPGSSGIDFLSGSLSRLRTDYGSDWDIASYAPR